MELDEIVNFSAYPIDNAGFCLSCRARLDEAGALVMPGFVTAAAVAAIRDEGLAMRDKVFAQESRHTVYLSPPDPELPADHPRNRLVTSSKGCLTDDQISAASPLRRLYDSERFRGFLCRVLGEDALFEYADPLSSINLHFAEQGQELGWHFDNSSFAVTLMIQPPEAGGQFEYVARVRHADSGDMGYDAVADVLDGRTPARTIDAQAGTLVLFRGRNALHRVVANRGERARILAVLAYNSEPGIALSPTARQAFYGRTA